MVSDSANKEAHLAGYAGNREIEVHLELAVSDFLLCRGLELSKRWKTSAAMPWKKVIANFSCARRDAKTWTQQKSSQAGLCEAEVPRLKVAE